MNRALIPRLERGRFHAEFLTEGLLRASTLERYQAYRVGLGDQPFLDVEWVRRRESLPPMPSNGGAA